MLKFGSKGREVTILQGQLTAAGFPVTADGDYGSKTEAAVKAFQKSAGLVIDGIAGSKTQAALVGAPTDKYLREADMIAAAKQLGVDVATVKAVNRVESAGSGFLNDGRTKILFERHIFYRELTTKLGKAAAQKYMAQRPDICNTATGGYKGGAAEWPRYAAACVLDAECAQKATSWGLFQIMGFNHAASGFENVADYATAMNQSEGAQLQAFANFIISNPKMHEALKTQDWAGFASRYNGPAYKRNNYDDKLKNAYAAFAGAAQKAA